MKTTIDIVDALLKEAKRVAAEEGTTLRCLVEERLRLAMERRRRKGTFQLRDASFEGGGLRPGVALEHWDEIRALIYGDRGG